MIVFADDPAKWTYPSRFVRTTTADDKGRFRINGLPPAERYLALAVEYLEDGEHYDPEFLERLRVGAVPFMLNESERPVLALGVFER